MMIIIIKNMTYKVLKRTVLFMNIDDAIIGRKHASYCASFFSGSQIKDPCKTALVKQPFCDGG